MSEQPTPTTTPPVEAAGFFVLRHFLVDLSVESPFGRLPDEVAASRATDQKENDCNLQICEQP